MWMKRYTLGSSSIGKLKKRYVNQVLANNFISPGPIVKEVEEICAALHGYKYANAINSGQSAIHVALQAIKETRLGYLKEKPLVAVPACTYISTLAAAILANCDIVLVDVEKYTANICPQDLQRVLRRQKDLGDPVDIIIPVHLFGKACRPEIFEIADKWNLYVVEDACEATLVPNTSKGHILTTSFFSNHMISGGGGGMIMTNDKEFDLYCWKLINHGRSARFDNNDIHRITEKFHFDVWGHSFKWNDISAAIVKAQFERRHELYKARQNNANILWKHLKLLEEGERVIFPESVNHCFMMFPIILNEPLDASRVIEELNNEGIEVRRMMPIINQPIVKDYFSYNLVEEFPNADFINRQGFYIGCHPGLSKKDMNEMSRILWNTIVPMIDEMKYAKV
jgi:dTDP-4-amino-4,6-dideoxygalactose transaminase